MNQLRTAKAPLAVAPGKKNPDVIVTHTNQTALFKMQNHAASEWLRQHYSVATGKITGHTEIYVHPSRCKRVIEELKAAGFEVAALQPEK
jgi:hypothetical protein